MGHGPGNLQRAVVDLLYSFEGGLTIPALRALFFPTNPGKLSARVGISKVVRRLERRGAIESFRLKPDLVGFRLTAEKRRHMDLDALAMAENQIACWRRIEAAYERCHEARKGK